MKKVPKVLEICDPCRKKPSKPTLAQLKEANAEFYVEWEEILQMDCVFDSLTGFCYGDFGSEEEAQKYADKRNEELKNFN